MTEMEIYWALKLDTIIAIAVLFACISAFLLICFIWYVLFEQEDGGEKKIKKIHIPIAVFSFIVFLCASIFVPTTSQMVKIKVVPILLSNKNVNKLRQIPEKVLGLLGVSIDKLTDTLKSGNDKNHGY